MLRKSKGVTPVLATVLLLFITIAAVGSASVFLQSTVDEVQRGAESQLEREQLVRDSSIRILSGFRDVNGFLNVEVRNTGSINLQIEEDSEKVWSLYLDRRPVSNWSSAADVMSPNQVVVINTSSKYPNATDDKEVTINAPYETEDRYICYNQGSNQC